LAVSSVAAAAATTTTSVFGRESERKDNYSDCLLFALIVAVFIVTW
jgi:hypothetical protein